MSSGTGFTSIHADGTPGAAFERADRAVHPTRPTGRNRTVADTELPPRTAPLNATP